MANNNPNSVNAVSITPEELAELRRKAAAHDKSTTITLKVSPKGAVSVYGVGRFPVTLYSSQWERILASGQHIQQFMEANRAALKVKE